MFTISEVMTTDPVTLSSEATLLDARALMASKSIKHLPIVDDGKLVGLVSETDLLEAADSILDGDSDTGHASHEAHIPLSEVMTRHVATVTPENNLRKAALFLQEHRYGCLPVIENGQLVGIITDYDFVTVAINLMEQMEMFTPDEMDDE